MADSLNLVGDGDDIDVIRDVERAFGIQIADHEAEAIRTVGQLYDLIQARCPGADRTQACLSQVAFYRLRRALATTDKRAITPQTPISIVRTIDLSSIRESWKELSRRSGLTLPSLEMPVRLHAMTLYSRLPFWMARTAITAIFAAVWIKVLRFPVAIFPFALPLLLIAPAFLYYFVPRDIPRRLETIGDLAREAAGYSFSEAFKSHAAPAPADRWQALLAILRQISGHKPPITRDTTFFTSDATR